MFWWLDSAVFSSLVFDPLERKPRGVFGGPFSEQRLVIKPTRREYYGIPERGYKKVKCNRRKFEFPPCSDIIAVSKVFISSRNLLVVGRPAVLPFRALRAIPAGIWIPWVDSTDIRPVGAPLLPPPHLQWGFSLGLHTRQGLYWTAWLRLNQWPCSTSRTLGGYLSISSVNLIWSPHNPADR